MNVCIIGNNLTSLTLAKTLINQGILVDIFSKKKVNKIDKTRTLGISKTNTDFFNKNILNINKLLWKIKKIEIFSERLKNEKLLNFQKKDQQLFSIIKNHELYDKLINELNRSKSFNLKRNFSKKKYKLIINCEEGNNISKNFFYKKIKKNYNSFAHTTVIKHKKLSGNNIAIQIFTKNGPLAFLPISETETSVVFSARGSANIDLEKIIIKFNKKYKIIKCGKKSYFKLKSTNLRTYYHQNILAFGDQLHRVHPLAGQGFNMTIRDVSVLLRLIKFKSAHGLDLDHSICSAFEKETRHKNYLFSNGIDFVYEFFNLDSKIKGSVLVKSLQFLGKNNYINNFFTKSADRGILN